MLQAYFEFEDENLWRLATGLGAGVGRQGFTCGAITGGALACGLVTALQRSSTREDRTRLRDETYSRIQEMTRRFEARFSSVECRSMTGCDFLTPEGQAAFKQENTLDRVCLPAVRLVVETVISLCG